MIKLGEKEKNAKRNAELERLLNGISQAPYPNLQHRHTLILSGDSPMSRVSLQSEFSPQSSFSNGFFSSEDGSPYSTPFEEANNHAPSTHYTNGLGLCDSHPAKNANEKYLSDFRLCENLQKMHIGEKDISTQRRRFERDPNGFGLRLVDGSLGCGQPYNDENYSSYEGLNNGAFGSERFKSSSSGVSTCFDGDSGHTLIAGSQGVYEKGDSLDSCVTRTLHSGLCPHPSCHGTQRYHPLEHRIEQGNWGNRATQTEYPFRTRPCLDEDFSQPQQYAMDSNGGRGVTDPMSSLRQPKLASDADNLSSFQSLMRARAAIRPNNRAPHPLVLMKGATDGDAFGCEDSYILQEKGLKNAVNKECDSLIGHKESFLTETAIQSLAEKYPHSNNCFNYVGNTENPQSLSSFYHLKLMANPSCLAEFQGSIYAMAKDQHGCRFLQRLFDDGTFLDVQIIFSEIIDHVVELMTHQFGNYLVQKLLHACSAEQRRQVVLKVTKEPGQLITISLNAYGTRVIQRLIETLASGLEISLVKSALKPGILNLFKDLNGSHVLQRCLEYLSTDDNKFIFYAAAKSCVEIATHQNGCVVLQRCIARSIGQDRDKIISQISRNGLFLAQNPFGNYVVQYIIELENPSVGDLLSQFRGHYVHLSVQKFSSHVVQKCLNFIVESRMQIVSELLSVPQFDQLLQHPFANYVIYTALTVTKGPLYASLAEAIRPHSVLRTSPYCKKIFSRNLLKKM